MRRTDELQIGICEIRAKLADPENSLKPPETTELRRKLAEQERDLAAEIRKEAEAEEKRDMDRKFRELRSGIEIRNYLTQAMTGGRVKGREAEFNKEIGIDDVNQLPLEALLDRREERADEIVDVSGAAPSMPRMPWLERMFQRTDSAFFGVRFIPVGAGEPSFPVLSSGGSGSAVADEAALEGEAVTLSAHSIAPARKGIRYRISAETLAKYGDETEDMLRRDARGALGVLTDSQVVSADGTGNNAKGIIGHADNIDSTGIADPADISVPLDFDKEQAKLIDGGPYAYDPSEVRMLIGTDTYKFLSSNRVQAAVADDDAGPRYLDLVTRGTPPPNATIRASNRVPAAAANIQKAFNFRPMELRVVCGIWRSIVLLRDPYSSSASSVINLTFFVLQGHALLRGKVYERRFKLA